MIGGLFSSLVQMGGAYGALRLKRLKAKLLLGVATLAAFLLFALLALLSLFLIIFTALAERYSPMAAAVTLFGIAGLFCLLTVLIHLIAARSRTAPPENDLITGLKAQLPSTLALGMALGRQTRNLFTPKKIILAVALAAGTALLSRPVTTYRLVRHLLHKDVETVARRRSFLSRYIR